MRNTVVMIILMGVSGGPAVLHAGTAQLLGPTPYKSSTDSPFSSLSFDYFHLEDFEDGLFNVPGVSADVGIVTSTRFAGTGLIDSVDGDDGDPTNNSCLQCDSYFHGFGFEGIRFTFSSPSLGSLPTHVGIVWTDGEGTTTFEAFDSAGASLGIVGPIQIADGSVMGTTEEDRFFGVIHEQGIAAIEISNSFGGIEVDHLQFGSLGFGSCVDEDQDGYGSRGTASCPSGDQEDCDDHDPRVFPDAPEVYDGIDNDCDGLIDDGLDDDGDGIPNFRDLCNLPSSGSGVGPDGCSICESDGDGDGFGATVDCDDGDADVHPGAPEVCNGRDDNCDSRTDEGFDQDGDGIRICENDCNDLDPLIRPGAAELPGNLVDENCDGSLGRCDPSASWSDHGEFVRCVSHECESLVAAGILTQQQCDALVSLAAQSDVGQR